MTMTESPPTTAPADATAPVLPTSERDDLAGWLTTVDHTRIGRLFVGGALAMLLGALGMGMLIGVERADPADAQFIDLDAAAALFSVWRWLLVLGGVVPLLLGLAIAVVPLQVGARSIAFPRAAGLAFWTWLASMGLLIGSYLADGGPGGGDELAVQLTPVAIALAAVSVLLGVVCVVATVLGRRRPGMSLDFTPATSWSWLAGGTLLLASLPVLVGMAIYVYVDLRYSGTFGGTDLFDTYLGWAFGQPQVLLYASFGLAVLVDAVLVGGTVRQRHRGIVMGGLAATAALGFGAWAQPAFAPSVSEDVVFAVFAIAAPLPVLVVLGGAADTIVRARRLTAPGAFALGGALMVLVGTLVGTLTPFSDLALRGTVYEQAYVDYLLLGAVLAGLGGLVHWGPRLWGRVLPSGPAYGLALLGFFGVVLAAFPNVVLGFLDQPLDAVNFTIDGPDELLNILSTVGYALVFVTVLGAIVVAAWGFHSGDDAGADPWGGATLEWEEPPAPGEPRDLTPIASPEPLRDRAGS